MDKSRQNETDVAASKAMANQDFTDSPNLMSIHPPGLQLKANGNSEASNQEEKIDGKTSLAAVKEFTAADPPNDADINTVQAKSKDAPTSVFQLQEKTNNTGLPNNLKSGVENLSGYSLDDVQVHYNSNKPAQLQAHAYAQGTDIHVASGQEKHLPHEAWHVVQQKQGRVQPTTQLKGQVPVNDDAGLENEADVMGAKALSIDISGAEDDLQMKSIGAYTAQLTRTDEQLQKRIGAPKMKKIKAAGLQDKFNELTNVRLAELRNMAHVDFDDLLKEIQNEWLDRDDDFEEEPEAQSRFGRFLGWFGFGADKDGEEDVYEHASKESHSGSNISSAQSLTPEVAKEVVEDKDEAEAEGEESESLAQKGLKMITINIVDGDLFDKQEGALGPAEYEASGSKSLEASIEGIKGKVEIEAQFGKGKKTLFGIGKLGSNDSNLNFGGTIEGFGGVKGEASGEAEVSLEDYSAKVKGKAGASAGVSVEGSLQVMLKAKGKELGKAQLKGGLMAGLAGELSGIFKFADGEFVIGSGGKLALGVGFTWNYKLVANTGLLGQVGDGVSSWASWAKKKIFG